CSYGGVNMRVINGERSTRGFTVCCGVGSLYKIIARRQRNGYGSCVSRSGDNGSPIALKPGEGVPGRMSYPSSINCDLIHCSRSIHRTAIGLLDNCNICVCDTYNGRCIGDGEGLRSGASIVWCD